MSSAFASPRPDGELTLLPPSPSRFPLPDSSVVALSSDDDHTIPSLTLSSQPFPFPQAPSVSHHDRLDSSSDDDFKPSKFCFSSTELPQKPAARRSSAAGTLVLDWSGTGALTFLPFELFGGGGGGRGRYEAVMPMGPKTISYEDEKSYVELDRVEYAERLRLRMGGGDKKGRRKSTTVRGAPVWANVGRHLQFNSHVNHITDELLTALFGWRRKKFVAVHLRQGDFLTLGRASSAMDEVVETFPAGVKQVQTALQARRKRSKELPVLFATDSGDPAFIAKLSKRGWIHINHIEFATTARFGGWSSGVLDSAILSRAEGFLGTRQSTFSSVAARRVESWNGGVTAIVG
ncbi:hypothetical protein JCM1841_003242 [Sporobolomyces salmonicolor]